MLRTNACTEALHRAGLFAGAVIFASWCAQWGYYFIRHSGRIGNVSSFGPMSAMFVAFGVYGAIALHDRFLKTAAILFVVQHLVGLLPNISATVTALLSNGLTGLIALLLIVGGARGRTRREVAVAIVAFAVSMAIFFGLTEYGHYVLGGRSVMSGR